VLHALLVEARLPPPGSSSASSDATRSTLLGSTCLDALDPRNLEVAPSNGAGSAAALVAQRIVSNAPTNGHWRLLSSQRLHVPTARSHGNAYCHVPGSPLRSLICIGFFTLTHFPKICRFPSSFPTVNDTLSPAAWPFRTDLAPPDLGRYDPPGFGAALAQLSHQKTFDPKFRDTPGRPFGAPPFHASRNYAGYEF
jgi:hypothetical protein